MPALLKFTQLIFPCPKYSTFNNVYQLPKSCHSQYLLQYYHSSQRPFSTVILRVCGFLHKFLKHIVEVFFEFVKNQFFLSEKIAETSSSRVGRYVSKISEFRQGSDRGKLVQENGRLCREIPEKRRNCLAGQAAEDCQRRG